MINISMLSIFVPWFFSEMSSEKLNVLLCHSAFWICKDLFHLRCLKFHDCIPCYRLFYHSLCWAMVNPFNTDTCVLQLGVFSCIQCFYRYSGKIREKWNMEFDHLNIKYCGLVFLFAFFWIFYLFVFHLLKYCLNSVFQHSFFPLNISTILFLIS